MAYTLIGSLRSPYVRLTRLFLLENKIPFEFKVINYLENPEHAAYLARVNPINKIPLLLDDAESIFDSRVIFNLLTRRYALPALTIQEENILTAIHGCLETSVNLVMLGMGGLDLEKPNWFIQREKERVLHCLSYLEPWASTAQEWSYLSMALYAYLDWALFRELIDLTRYPAIAQFFERFARAPGVEDTSFRLKS